MSKVIEGFVNQPKKPTTQAIVKAGSESGGEPTLEKAVLGLPPSTPLCGAGGETGPGPGGAEAEKPTVS